MVSGYAGWRCWHARWSIQSAAGFPDVTLVCRRVQENGVLITLGPISRDSERVTVPSDILVACLSDLSATFVLEQEGDE